MAVEFSRRPLLSLQLSLRLSIFNLNSSCNWLEGLQGGTLLVGCAVPHRSQCAGSLFLLKAFCCNAEICHCITSFIFRYFCRSFQSVTFGGGLLRGLLGYFAHSHYYSSTVLRGHVCVDSVTVRRGRALQFQRHDPMICWQY